MESSYTSTNSYNYQNLYDKYVASFQWLTCISRSYLSFIAMLVKPELEDS